MLGIVSGVVLARYLGPAERGNLSIIIVSLSFFSLLGEVVNGGNEIIVGKNKSLQSAIMKQSFVWCSLIALIVYFSLAYFKPKYLVDIIFKSDEKVFYYFTLLFALIALNESYKRIILARQGFIFINRLQITASLFYTVMLIILVLYLDINILTVMKLMILQQMLIFVIYFYRLVGRLEIYRKSKYSFSLLKESLPIGSRSVLIGLPTLLLLSSDIYIIRILIDDFNVGLYQIAVSVSSLILIPSRILNTIIRAKAVSEKDGEKRALIISKIFLILSMSITILFFFLGKIFIEFLYGIEYSESFLPALILCFAHVIYGTSNIIGGIILAKNKYPLFLVFGLNISFVLNCILNFYFIPKYGINGAAFSSMIAYLIMNIFYCYRFIQHAGFPLKDFLIIRKNMFIGILKNLQNYKIP